MKTFHIVLALTIVMLGTAFAACHYQHKIDNQIVTQRVYEVWGQGDYGLDINHYLLTGEETDFFADDEEDIPLGVDSLYPIKLDSLLLNIVVGH